MNRGCRNFKKGDVVKGLLITIDPYKVEGDKNYRSIVKCILCDSEPYEIVLSEINRHVFDGCGCQKDRSNSIYWLSFKDWCVQNNQQQLLDLWDYDLNNKTPDKVSSCTSDYYYFKCPCGKHESSLWKILSLTRRGKVKTICKKCNSFAQFAIDKFGEDVLNLYWDYDKNIVDPWEISHGSKNQIWIKCQNITYHESYLILPTLFLNGVGCPYCHGNRIHPNDSFAYYYIKKYGVSFLEIYWDYENNTLDPWTIAVQTNKDYIYLKCDKHGSYPVLPSNFYKFGITCPECTREQDKSKLQDKVEKYIIYNYHFDVMHEYNCSIITKNPKTNRWLPYDNDVTINNNHLIIEVMGEQHYSKDSGWIRKESKRLNLDRQQVLDDLQWRDEYKKQYAISQGYYYLAIPYWTESDESYKTLIDNKIQEILNNTKLTA
jgi:hypothetical protein